MRSIFNHRFGIILYWYIITTCIHHTNQQQNVINQEITEQKIQKLADRNVDISNKNSNSISHSSLSACTNCTVVISSTDELSQNQKLSKHDYRWSSLLSPSLSSSSSSSENLNYRHQHGRLPWQKHQIRKNFHRIQFLNKQKLSRSNKNIANHFDSDSLTVDNRKNNHLTWITPSSSIPSQLPSPPSVLHSIKSGFSPEESITTTASIFNEASEVKTKASSQIPSSQLSLSSSPLSLSEQKVKTEIKSESKSLLTNAEVNKENEIRSLSSDNSQQQRIKNDDISFEYKSDYEKYSTKSSNNKHENFTPNRANINKKYSKSEDNMFYNIFHKFSLANIFNVNTDSNKNSIIENVNNNYDKTGNYNNDLETDTDSYYEDDDKNKIISNEFHSHRMKRNKRDLNIETNKMFTPSFSSLPVSSSNSFTLNVSHNLSSSSSLSVPTKKRKKNIKFGDIKSGKTDNKTLSLLPSVSPSSFPSSSVSDIKKVTKFQKEQNQHQQHLNHQLTTHSSILPSTRIQNNDNSSLKNKHESVINNNKNKNSKNNNNNHNINIYDNLMNSNEPIIIIDDGEEFESGLSSTNLLDHSKINTNSNNNNNNNNTTKHNDEEYMQGDDPRFLPSSPIIRGPYYDNDNRHHQKDHFNTDDNGNNNSDRDVNDDDDEISVVYAEQHSEIKLTCDIDSENILKSVWFKNGQTVHTLDRNSRSAPDYRFIKEQLGGLTITNVMLEDDGEWQCEAEISRGLSKNARPIKLVVLDRPKPPYLLIDSRRLDAGNIFVPVKENSELSLACVSEGGNPKPTLTWEVLLSPGVDRHAQKVAAEVLELEEIKHEKEKEPYKINSGAKSEARLPAVYRAHHNARILCVMEHPTLKMRQNASLLLDVQYTPSFAISRTPGFGYPLREGIEVSLKCDVDSNPPSTPRWQKDDGDTPVPQTGDGFLNFTSIRREHSGWYKCTSRHLNFQYSSIGYYLSVRYDSVDVTSEPDDQEVSVAASHNPNKGQLEVQLGGAVTLQCPQGSLGCWSHLDPVTARLRGLGVGLSTPTGQFSLKDVVYQDAGTYKCIGQSPSNKKKLEVLQTVGVLVKGPPTVSTRNSTPIAYPGSPLHLTVEFCANPPAYAARWLHGDRVYTPGNQYGSTVLAYGVTDLPTPFCKEARLTYVSMHERVPRTFYFIVSSPGGVAEAIFKVNFTLRYRTMSNSVDDEEEELSEPEEIHFPVFGNSISIHRNYHNNFHLPYYNYYCIILNSKQLLSFIIILISKLFIIQ